MWLTERYTFSRGRAVVPATFLRMRVWIFSRVKFLELLFSMMLPRPSLRPQPRVAGTQAARLNPVTGNRSVPAKFLRRGCADARRILVRQAPWRPRPEAAFVGRPPSCKASQVYGRLFLSTARIGASRNSHDPRLILEKLLCARLADLLLQLLAHVA